MMYDLVIIGGGPAGLTAAVYAARYKLNTLVIVAEEGGLAATAHKICNFPSQTEITGAELMQRMKSQVEDLKVPIIFESVTKLQKINEHIVISTDKTKEYKCKKLLIATGTKRKKLDVKGEDKFYGKGVSYCATCDAAFYSDRKVAVIGGSDAALTAALLLSEFAKEVIIIYRQEKFFRGDRIWIDAVEKNKKIKKMFGEVVSEIKGDDFVTSLELESGKSLDVEGVFIEVGSEPSSLIFKDIGTELDEKGYVKVDKNQKTNVENVFAAGDITNNILKQIITAAAEGAVAVHSIYKETVAE